MMAHSSIPDGNHNRAQTEGAKSRKIPINHILNHLRDTRGKENAKHTQSCPCKQTNTCNLWIYKHIHQAAKKTVVVVGRGGWWGGWVTRGASSFSQIGYLQRPVLHQPGETSPGLRQCLGGAWAPGHWIWTCPPGNHQKTKTHLQRQAGTLINVEAQPECGVNLWAIYEHQSRQRGGKRESCAEGISIFKAICGFILN